MVTVPPGWSDFNVAMVGATAALAGLVIVAASVNITVIIKAPSLTARLAAGISTLVLALVGSGVGLVPGLTMTGYGIVMLIAVVGACPFLISAARRIFQNRHPDNRNRFLKAAVGVVPVAAYGVGGILLLTGVTGGLAWFAAGAVLAVVCALFISWVVLVEVLR